MSVSAPVATSPRVVARSRLGQFRVACEQGGTETVRKSIQKGARLSRKFAPVGHRDDPRTTKLSRSIEWEMLSGNSGRWFAHARHALAIEEGAGPHEITGDVTFFWEKKWRMWKPGDNMIQHPGNAPQPYLRPAFELVMSDIMQIARSEYP